VADPQTKSYRTVSPAAFVNNAADASRAPLCFTASGGSEKIHSGVSRRERRQEGNRTAVAQRSDAHRSWARSYRRVAGH